MQKIVFVFIPICVTIFFTFQAKSQNIENSINLMGTNFPQEKIHIHFDKESYLPGETIWFKAYLFEENLPSERSTNFYAAIYDETGMLVEKFTGPLLGSTTDGHFTIPDTLKSSQLICRAYTSWMMNFDSSVRFTRAIKIIGNGSDIVQSESNRKTSFQFFPEGGNLIEGVVNTIAFKSNYNNGLPFQVDGVIKKQETGEVVVPLKVVHDGMGKFDLEIVPGEKYYAEWTDNSGAKQQTWLPEAKQKGLALKISAQKNKLFFNLVNKTGNDSLHVLMYMYQKVFYKTNIAVDPSSAFTGTIPLNELPSGTVQITVFDAGWQPVAERIAFINNNNYSINATVIPKEINTKERSKNLLEIIMADTIPANLSLSITDAAFDNDVAENSIVSDFLLKGDLKGYIHNPAYYFTSNTDPALRAALDLVLLTNGWRRYNFEDLKVQKMPVVQFENDNYLNLYGQISEDAFAKLEREEQVNLIIKTIDSTNIFYSVIPEKNGLVKQQGVIFYDSASVYFSFNKSKPLNKQMTFSNANFLLRQSPVIDDYRNYLWPGKSKMIEAKTASLYKYYAANDGVKLFNEEKTLGTVVVKTGGNRNWRNDPLVKLDERYASGMFTGGANNFSIDVLHDEKAWTKLDVFNYIRSAVPGLVVGSFNATGGRSLTYQGATVNVYIDEQEMTTSDIEVLSLEDIAYIKLIPRYFGRGPDAGGAGYAPAISIYRKKGDDMIDRRPKVTDLNQVKVAGYSPLKEFYSPDYSKSNTTTGTDARTTLLWLPYILTEANRQKVPITFYNNDFTKKMRIVLEGINEDGKIIRIEKIVE